MSTMLAMLLIRLEAVSVFRSVYRDRGVIACAKLITERQYPNISSVGAGGVACLFRSSRKQ